MARRALAPRPGLTHTRADLRQPAAAGALAGVDVLYHLGFQLWTGKGGPAGMARANREGTANVVGCRPGHVVLASSAAVYGAWPGNPLPLTEDDLPRPNPQCPYAVHKLEAERACAAAAPTLSLRIAAVLGDHADHRVARAARGYRAVVAAVPGTRPAHPFVDEADVVAALVAAGRALAGPGATTGVLNIATTDWLDAPALAAVTGGRVLAAPRSVVMGLSEAGRRLGVTPFGADRAVLLCGPLALDITRAAAALGWRPSLTSAEVVGRASGRR